MSDKKKKWYNVFVSVEDEEGKSERTEDIGKIESFPELPPPSRSI